MPRFPRGVRLLCTMALLLQACGGGGTGPGPAKLSNAANTAAQLQYVTAPFATGAYESFAALHQHFGPAGSAAAATAAAPARGTAWSLELAPAHAFAWSAAATGALHEALGSQPVEAAIFPDIVRGKTFVWDTTAAAYVASITAGAPANVVRFLLYTTRPPPATVPSRPLSVIGYADLTDRTASSAAVLGLAVVGTTGPSALTYADYSVSRPSGQSGTWGLAGSVTDGVTRLDLTSTLTGTFAGLSVQTAVDVAAEGVHVSETVNLSRTLAVQTDFSLTSGGETVRANGTITFDTAAHRAAGSLAVTVNGQAFATITLGAVGPSYTGASGVQLTSGDEAALRNLFLASLDLFAAVTVLTDPAWVLSL